MSNLHSELSQLQKNANFEFFLKPTASGYQIIVSDLNDTQSDPILEDSSNSLIDYPVGPLETPTIPQNGDSLERDCKKKINGPLEKEAMIFSNDSLEGLGLKSHSGNSSQSSNFESVDLDSRSDSPFLSKIRDMIPSSSSIEDSLSNLSIREKVSHPYFLIIGSATLVGIAIGGPVGGLIASKISLLAIGAGSAIGATTGGAISAGACLLNSTKTGGDIDNDGNNEKFPLNRKF